MKTLQKLRNNLLSEKAVSVLGPAVYARYFSAFLANIPNLLRARNMRSLDQFMGIYAKQFRYRGRSFIFDCQFCDEHLDEESFGFGIAREVYIRDCYFRWHPAAVFKNARTVIDLGANRGAFSALMTTQANFILSVECSKQYLPILRHNMSANNYRNYAIENAIVGAGGEMADSKVPRITMDELFDRYGLVSVDLVKIDIEGSEFALFQSSDWLKRVNAISMEVHPIYGDSHTIAYTLGMYGFTCETADENLECVKEGRQPCFIYAWRTT